MIRLDPAAVAFANARAVGLLDIEFSAPRGGVSVGADTDTYEDCRARLREAYAADQLSLLELEVAADRLARSPVFRRLVERGCVLVLPRTAFVYWNATTHACEGCGNKRRISRVHLGRIGDGGSFALCRPCINELAALGVAWR